MAIVELDERIRKDEAVVLMGWRLESRKEKVNANGQNRAHKCTSTRSPAASDGIAKRSLIKQPK